MIKNTQENLQKSKDFESYRRSDVRFWFRLLTLVIVVPVYLILIISLLAMPRSTVSNIEKRQLAVFPEFSWESYWSGEYTSDIATYFDDTVPYRDSLKQAASQLLKFLGIKYNDVQVSGPMAVVNDTQSNSEQTDNAVNANNTSNTNSNSQNKDNEKDTDNSKNYGQEIADGVYTNGQIVVYQDGHYRAMSMFGGGTGEVYATSLNNLAADLPNVKIYSMLAPTPSEFYTPSNFKDYNASQAESFESIASMLQGVTPVDIVSVLEKHTTEPIYTRTDHHWQALGAYYAAQTFAKAAGVPFADISTYEKVDIDGYVGTMYAFTDNNADIFNDPETFTYYKPQNNYTTQYYDQTEENLFGYLYTGDLLVDVAETSSLYLTFMGGDAYIARITTDVNNGRKLLVVKDSYGNAEIPFYTGSFSEIYVMDVRYFAGNIVDFANQLGITDMLFTMCSYSAVGTNADYIEGLRTQNKGLTYKVYSETEPVSDSASTVSEDSSSEEEPNESDVDNSIDDGFGDEDYDYNDDNWGDDYSYDYGEEDEW